MPADRLAAVVLLAVSAATLSAQQPVVRDSATHFAAPRLLTASVPGGIVEIIGEVRTDVSAQSSHRAPAVQLYPRGDSLHLSIAAGLPAPAVHLVIRVPAATALRIAVPGGDVRITGVTGLIELRPISGRVAVTGGGDVRADGAAATLRLSHLTGGANVRSVTGHLLMDDIAGDITARTRSGSIRAVRGHGTTVRLQTTSGRIAWDGRLDPVGVYEFASTNGPITVTLPPGAHASGSIDHLRGKLAISSTLTMLEQKPVGNREQISWSASPGSGAAGGAHVVIGSVTGTIALQTVAAPAPRRPARRQKP